MKISTLCLLAGAASAFESQEDVENRLVEIIQKNQDMQTELSATAGTTTTPATTGTTTATTTKKHHLKSEKGVIIAGAVVGMVVLGVGIAIAVKFRKK